MENKEESPVGFPAEFPVPKKEIEVFDKKPAPCFSTFDRSLPIERTSDYSVVMVFYSADVKQLVYLDNTASEAETSFTDSMSVGFSHSTKVGVTLEVGCEIQFKFVKLGITFSVNVEFTFEWSEVRTKEIQITVPARKKAFLYQAFINCQKLRLDHKTGKYEYIGQPEVLDTESYETTEMPLR